MSSGPKPLNELAASEELLQRKLFRTIRAALVLKDPSPSVKCNPSFKSLDVSVTLNVSHLDLSTSVSVNVFVIITVLVISRLIDRLSLIHI